MQGGVVLARYPYSSFNVAVGLLAAFLKNVLVLSSFLEGRPVVSDVTVVSCVLSILMKAFTVFHGTSFEN